MLKPTLITWILIIFGALLIFLPMLYAQLLMALRPHSRKAKDIIIGKGEDWRDKTHFRMSQPGVSAYSWGRPRAMRYGRRRESFRCTST